MGRNKEFDYDQKLDVAMNLFWAQGYHSTSISDLENHMGVNRSSIYPTYGDKKALLMKCLDKYLKLKVSEYKNILNGSQSNAVENLKRILRLAIDQSISEGRTCLAVKIAFEISPTDEEIIGLLSQNEKIIEKIYFQILKSGQEAGVIKNNLDIEVTAAFFSCSSGALLKKYALNKNRKEVYDMIEILIQMVKA
ncbi:TetR/AcrR family transcriptional regulator [Pedobacter sp. CFBP9032]|uniref:TetR/AcrR family transcriptional regulator n=1 Tax=Pedobacter sp. CFBP9032 TaxID=3096539 RepID=UPI002A6A34CE|nr:TetR/AcrR family transcriptional regulator [Pedobacter sp. CFBP9032]MDY0905454.1 TetR/AcrR family transcriptional regulator [Pedobacter sp. CFBP9032]